MKNFVRIAYLLVVFGIIYSEATDEEDQCTNDGKIDYCCVAFLYEEKGMMKNGRLELGKLKAEVRRIAEGIPDERSRKKLVAAVFRVLEVCVPKANAESDRCAVAATFNACNREEVKTANNK